MPELKPWLALIFQRPERLITGGLLMLLTLLAGMGLLALSGWFITATALTGLLLAAGVQASLNLYIPGGGIRLFAVTRTVARYLERVYNHDTVLRLLTDIRVTLFRQLSLAKRGSRSALRGSQWLSRLTSDVDALDTLYLRLIAPTALAALVTMLLVITAALFYSWQLALILLALLTVAFVGATVAVFVRTRALTSRQTDETEEIRTGVIEHLDGFAELTAAGRTGKHAAWLLRNASWVTRQQAETETRVGWHSALTQAMINLAVVCALWVGLQLYSIDAVSGPVMVLLPIALLGLGEVYAMLPDAFGRLGGTIASAARLNRDCHDTPERHPAPETSPALQDNVAVEIRNLTLRHPNHPPLMTHFNLSVERGQWLGIIGVSGSGKSSLADALAGLITPTAGSLITRECCYLTQQTVLFEDTLRSNLLLGHSGATDQQLWGVLELVGMAERFVHEPEQLNTWLGASGSRLSGGEARRIALARVLLSSRPIVILDEPFTGVDATTRDRINARLPAWLSGKTVISLGHAPEAIPDSGAVVHLS